MLLRLCLILTLLLAPAAGQSKDWIPGKRMDKAVDRILGKARLFASKQKLFFAYHTCIIAGFLEKEGSMGYTRNFEKGKIYYLLAGGDDNAYDLDIEIYDKNDKQVAADNENDNSPVLKFEPPETGEYRMKIILHDADKRTGSFCCLVVLGTTGYDIPVDSLMDCLNEIIKKGEEADAATGNLLFHSGSGQMALIGVVLPPRENEATRPPTISKGEEHVKYVIGLSFFKREYIVIAAGDGKAKHLTLGILDGNDKELKADKSVSRNPVVRYTPATNNFRAGLRLTNETSEGPSLCMCALLCVGEK
jgi:hypothetical protein